MSTDALLQSLKQARQGAAADGTVTIQIVLLDQVSEHVSSLQEQLIQADEAGKPSVVRKLTTRIHDLETEINQLRNQYRVSELEKKVQRLEVELKNSYASKNFTLKDGLLDIEKEYREYIDEMPEAQSMWAEIKTLLNDACKDVTPSLINRTLPNSVSTARRTFNRDFAMSRIARNAVAESATPPQPETSDATESATSRTPSFTSPAASTVSVLAEKVAEKLERLDHEGMGGETTSSPPLSLQHSVSGRRREPFEDVPSPVTDANHTVPELKAQIEEKLNVLHSEGREVDPALLNPTRGVSSTHLPPSVSVDDSNSPEMLSASPSITATKEQVAKQLGTLRQQGFELDASSRRHSLTSMPSFRYATGHMDEVARAALDTQVTDMERTAAQVRGMFRALTEQVAAESGSWLREDKGAPHGASAVGQQLDALAESVRSVERMAAPDGAEAAHLKSQASVLLASIEELRASYLATLAQQGGMVDPGYSKGSASGAPQAAPVDPVELQRRAEALLHSVAKLRLMFGQAAEGPGQATGERVWRSGGSWWMPGSSHAGMLANLAAANGTQAEDAQLSVDMTALMAVFSAFVHQAQANGALGAVGKQWQRGGAWATPDSPTAGRVGGADGEESGAQAPVPALNDMLGMFRHFLLSNSDTVHKLTTHLRQGGEGAAATTAAEGATGALNGADAATMYSAGSFSSSGTAAVQGAAGMHAAGSQHGSSAALAAMDSAAPHISSGADAGLSGTSHSYSLQASAGGLPANGALAAQPASNVGDHSNVGMDRPGLHAASNSEVHAEQGGQAGGGMQSPWEGSALQVSPIKVSSSAPPAALGTGAATAEPDIDFEVSLGAAGIASNWPQEPSELPAVQLPPSPRLERHSAPDALMAAARESAVPSSSGRPAVPSTSPAAPGYQRSRSLQNTGSFSFQGNSVSAPAETPTTSTLLASYRLQPTQSGRFNLQAVASSISSITRKYPSVLAKAPEAEAMLSELSTLVETLVTSHNSSLGGTHSPGQTPRTSDNGLPAEGASASNSFTQTTVTAAATDHERQQLENDIAELRQSNQDLALRVREYELTFAQLQQRAAEAEKEAQGGSENSSSSTAGGDTAAATEVAANGLQEDTTGTSSDDVGLKISLLVSSQPELLASCTETAKKVSGELSALQTENDYLTRTLIDAKIDLANTKGEYLELLKGVRKVLTRESTTMGKLAELERVLAVVAPGEVAVLQREQADPMESFMQDDYFMTEPNTRRSTDTT